MRSDFTRALVLVVAAAAVGLVVNRLRPAGVALAAYQPPTQCAAGGEAAAPVVEEVAPGEAAAWCAQPDVVIADARPAEAFAEGHVAGAVHLPCAANGQAATEALAHFERARRIVVYGQSSAEARPVAESLQRRLPKAKVQVLAGGFAAWAGAGLACASGPCDECKTAPAVSSSKSPAPSSSSKSPAVSSSNAAAPSGGKPPAPSSSKAAAPSGGRAP
jgi:rhodanese-related sulfurtransferase